ncbi:MAG TPA: hypothetical protein VMT03_16435 [Polyangia bacterium]|nr:hypothetical protein [Polyangia bacterium]
MSFGVARAIATPASPPAQPAASAVVTPKTDRPPAAGALSEAFAGTARASRASVVRIDVEMSGRLHAMAPGAEPQPDDQDALPPGTGSGVVVDASGDIVTNSHCGGSRQRDGGWRRADPGQRDWPRSADRSGDRLGAVTAGRRLT